MLPLSRPTRDPVRDYDTVTSSDTVADRRALLEAARSVVVGAYPVYEGAMTGGPTCVPVVTLASGAPKALRDSYDALPNRLATVGMRQDLLDIALEDLDGVCPFCGIDQAVTLDHYAAKEKFPEFALLATNLVACCWRCNHKKGRRSASAIEGIEFFHPYFHDAPAVLEAELREKDGTLYTVFMLTRPEECDADLYSKLEHQVRTLDTLRFLARAGNAELTAYSPTCEGLYGGPVGNPQAVSDSSRRKAEVLEKQWGVNHWQAVLHRALSEDVDYCDGGFRKVKQRHVTGEDQPQIVVNKSEEP